MRRLLILAGGFLGGAVVLSLFSTMQKLAIGYPLALKGYPVPFVFGGLAGTAGAFFCVRLLEANRRLEREAQERQAALTTLEESEFRLRTIMNSVLAGVIIVDPATRTFLHANAAALKMIGVSWEELRGRQCHQVFCSAADGKCPLLDLGQHEDCQEHELVRADGSRVPVLKTAVTVKVGGREALFETFIDLSEHKQAVAQAHRLERFEAIGVLAAGVAHDLNNILTGIVSYPDLLLGRLPEDDRLRGPLLSIQKAGQRAAAVVQDLLTLTRKGLAQKTALDLNGLVQDYLESPEGAEILGSRPHLQLETDLGSGLPPVSGSAVHLHRALHNLVQNAVSAIPEGRGRIRIATARAAGSGEGGHCPETGAQVALSISDTGVGLSKADRERIFDPYYTKQVLGRQSIGLGLTMVWNIVQEHGGRVEVDSRLGAGTNFTLFLPEWSGSGLSPAFLLRPEQLILGHGEQVLVVDDDQTQRALTCEMLESLGYEAEAVAGGEEALAYLRARRPDLVILDMIMPGMDGLETFTRLRAIRPGQKVLIASGYAEGARVYEMQARGAGSLLKKPFTLAALSTHVHGALYPAREEGHEKPDEEASPACLSSMMALEPGRSTGPALSRQPPSW